MGDGDGELSSPGELRESREFIEPVIRGGLLVVKRSLLVVGNGELEVCGVEDLKAEVVRARESRCSTITLLPFSVPCQIRPA